MSIAALLARPRRLLDQWLFQLRGSEPAPILLVQRRVFVLPNRAGIAFAVTLILLLIGSTNYLLGMGFVLTFLLAGLGVVAILQTFRNLVHLQIDPGRAPPVFAGEPAGFTLLLTNRRDDPRHALRFFAAGGDSQVADVPAAGSAPVTITLPTRRRGWLVPGRVTIDTSYPLGIIRAWSYVEPDMRVLVYPAPEQDPPPMPPPQGGSDASHSAGAGSDDFSGLRNYQTSDSPRHIAWKSVARDGPWLTKQFTGGGSASLWLDWETLPPALGVEARLARLTAYVLEASRRSLSFGLKLPGRAFPPGRGDAHRDACLKALALHGEDRQA